MESLEEYIIRKIEVLQNDNPEFSISVKKILSEIKITCKESNEAAEKQFQNY